MRKVLKAEPQPMEIDITKLALLVIDMQNAFACKGGMFDLWGIDIAPTLKIIGSIRELVERSREKGVKVIYVAHRIEPDLKELGPHSPFWFGGSMRCYREKPEMRDKLIIRGTWGAEIIEELQPKDEDYLVEKTRFSAFAGTRLDVLLRSNDIRYLAFTGVATNICVESSLRDAFHLQYFPFLVSDGVATGSAAAQEATIRNVIQCFGWVTNRANFVKAIA